MIHAFFDESGTHYNSEVLCVAGYAFDDVQFQKLDDEWRDALARYNIRHFRMSECAHGTGEFDGKPREHRIELEKLLIGIIKRRMMMGVAVAVSDSLFREVLSEDERERHGHAYTTCAHLCLTFFGDWLEKLGSQEPVAYFFESGHPEQAQAHRIMSQISHPLNDDVKERLHYSSHTFADKVQVRPLQAADLLAWQYRKFLKDAAYGKRRARRDFEVLQERAHFLVNPDRVFLEKMSAHTREFYEGKRLQFEALKALIAEQRSRER